MAAGRCTSVQVFCLLGNIQAHGHLSLTENSAVPYSLQLFLSSKFLLFLIRIKGISILCLLTYFHQSLHCKHTQAHGHEHTCLHPHQIFGEISSVHCNKIMYNFLRFPFSVLSKEREIKLCTDNSKVSHGVSCAVPIEDIDHLIISH